MVGETVQQRSGEAFRAKTSVHSSMISRLRRDCCRWRLSICLSFRAFSDLLYLVFTGRTPQRGSRAREAALAYSGDMTT